MTQKPKQTTRSDRKLTALVWGLIRADLDWIGRGILKIIHVSWWNHPIPTPRVPETHPDLPQGPYLPTRPRHRGDLLIFVPRSLESLLIDHLTGGYGYSHLAVDCGEVDGPTRKPVMIESTTGEVVQRKFQDEYGPRRFVRIPLTRAGVNPETFCECAASKLGQPYDDLEALTWGDIDDPAKQVCSDLAAVCLPEEMRQDIAQQARDRKLRRMAVSVHSRPSTHNIREFISPNGFAEYFGAPAGKDITQPDQLVIPHRPGELVSTHRPVIGWAIGMALASAGVLGVFLLTRRNAHIPEVFQRTKPMRPHDRAMRPHDTRVNAPGMRPS